LIKVILGLVNKISTKGAPKNGLQNFLQKRSWTKEKEGAPQRKTF
jgi:hypothetical protein